jgi:hypothetical protein
MKTSILSFSISLFIFHTIFSSAQEIVKKYRKSTHGFMITYHKGTKVCSQWAITGRIKCSEFISHNGVHSYKQLPSAEFARIEAEYIAQEQRKQEEINRKIKESAAAVVNAGAAGAGAGK